MRAPLAAAAMIGSMSADVDGVVITERIVSTAPGSAAGTFSAVGAIVGTGTVVAVGLGWLGAQADGAGPAAGGSECLVTAVGEVRIQLNVTLHPVPGTCVLIGGGTWHVASGSGEFDGARAAGTLTVKAVREEGGSTALDLILTGRATR